MRHDQPGVKWVPIYEFLRTQPVGVEIPWRQLSQLTDHDLKRSRGALIMVRKALAEDGLGLGGNTPTGIQVVKL